MTEPEGPDTGGTEPKRFDVELFIVHPSLDPAEISAGLGLDAHFAHGAGTQRKTPRGASLSGVYPDTRWRHCRRHQTEGQFFVDKIDELLDCVEARRDFLKNLRSTGGNACIIVQLLGDGYFGDQIPRETLARLIDLDLDLAFECYSSP